MVLAEKGARFAGRHPSGMVFEERRPETEKEKKRNRLLFGAVFRDLCLSGQRELTSLSFLYQLPGIPKPTLLERFWQSLGFSVSSKETPGGFSVCTFNNVELMITDTERTLVAGRIFFAVSEEEWERARLPGMKYRKILLDPPVPHPMTFFVDTEEILRVKI
jgi:hypothetical protein